MARNLKIETAPSATAATTAARIRVRYPILVPVADAILEQMISEATADAEVVIGRPLARQTYRELLSGSGTELLRLGRAPLESVTSIKLDDTTLESTAYGLVDAKQPSVRRLIVDSPTSYTIWPLARRGAGHVESFAVPTSEELLNIEAVYVAGYFLPSMSGSAPAGSHVLPISVESAVQRLVLDRYEEEQRGQGVASIKKGDREIRYVEGVGEMSKRVCEVLERERDVYQ
jgi:hypothetical protein